MLPTLSCTAVEEVVKDQRISWRSFTFGTRKTGGFFYPERSLTIFLVVAIDSFTHDRRVLMVAAGSDMTDA